MSKVTSQEQEARDRLRDNYGLERGSTVWTMVKWSNSDGDAWDISAYVVGDKYRGEYQIFNISGTVAQAGVGTWVQKRLAVRVGGGGMDMAVSVVYDLGMILFGDGYALTKRDLSGETFSYPDSTPSTTA